LDLKELDKIHFELCEGTAKESNCYSRQFGAILVDKIQTVSYGYNGPPKGMPNCGIRYHGNDPFLKKETEKLNLPLTPHDNIICPRKYLGYGSGEGLNMCMAVHAEQRAILQAKRNGIKTEGLIMFVNSPVPCSKCLLTIIEAGIKEVVVTSMDCYDKASLYILNNSKLKIRVYEGIKEKKY
jgi:dCMP deaminase